jgi:hypothetical protein
LLPAISVSGNNPILIHVNQPNETADEATAPEASAPSRELAPANNPEVQPAADNGAGNPSPGALPATGTQ